MGDATRVMELHRETQMPLSWCLQAVREGGEDRLKQMRVLRRLFREKHGKSLKGTTWDFPPTIKDGLKEEMDDLFGGTNGHS